MSECKGLPERGGVIVPERDVVLPPTCVMRPSVDARQESVPHEVVSWPH